MRRFGLAMLAVTLGCTAGESSLRGTEAGPASVECMYDGDCGDDARCDRGACLSASPSIECGNASGPCRDGSDPIPCATARDCGEAQRCEDQVCTEAPTPSRALAAARIPSEPGLR